jgi:hypothetical protein
VNSAVNLGNVDALAFVFGGELREREFTNTSAFEFATSRTRAACVKSIQQQPQRKQRLVLCPRLAQGSCSGRCTENRRISAQPRDRRTTTNIDARCSQTDGSTNTLSVPPRSIEFHKREPRASDFGEVVSSQDRRVSVSQNGAQTYSHSQQETTHYLETFVNQKQRKIVMLQTTFCFAARARFRTPP